MRLLPGRLAGATAGPRPWTATPRSAAARSTGSPRRCAMGARSPRPTDRFAPLDGPRPAAGDRLRPAGVLAQVKSCVLLAGLWRKARPRSSSRCRARPHRAHARRGRRDVHRNGLAVSVTNGRARARRRSSCPATRPRPPSVAAGVLVAGSRIVLDRPLRRTGRGRVSSHRSSGWAPSWSASSRSHRSTARRRRAGGANSTSPTARSSATPVSPRGPAGDRRAAAGRAARLLRRGRDDRPRAQELRLKETDRIATVVDGLNGLGGDLEATARRLRRPRLLAGCAAARSTPTATPGSRCSAPSPASPPRTASTSWAWRRPTVLSGVRADSGLDR